jgi:hypothetical protein
MREIRLYGSEGGGAVCSPYPYPGWSGRSRARFLPEGIGIFFRGTTGSDLRGAQELFEELLMSE